MIDVKLTKLKHIRLSILRALIPVYSDPLEVEVNGRPEVVGHPGAVVLFGLDEPLSILDHHDGSKGRSICGTRSIDTCRKVSILKCRAPAAGDPNRTLGSVRGPM